MNNNQSHGFSREQKMGFIFMLIFALLTVSLGALQLRNTIYGPFVIRGADKNNVALIVDEQTRLQQIDTDQDGISDYQETFFYQTSAYLPDTDSDGIVDKVEIDQGTDPLCAEGTTCVNDDELLDLVATSSLIIPPLNQVPTPLDIVSQAQTANADAVDLEAALGDPKKLREIILGTGKIQSKDLAKIDDVTLLQIARELQQQQASALIENKNSAPAP